MVLLLGLYIMNKHIALCSDAVVLQLAAGAMPVRLKQEPNFLRHVGEFIVQL